jgi:hypothetical protein
MESLTWEACPDCDGTGSVYIDGRQEKEYIQVNTPGQYCPTTIGYKLTTYSGYHTKCWKCNGTGKIKKE